MGEWIRETGSVPKKKENKSTTGIGASLTSEFRDNEECNNNLLQLAYIER